MCVSRSKTHATYPSRLGMFKGQPANRVASFAGKSVPNAPRFSLPYGLTEECRQGFLDGGKQSQLSLLREPRSSWVDSQLSIEFHISGLRPHDVERG